MEFQYFHLFSFIIGNDIAMIADLINRKWTLLVAIIMMSCVLLLMRNTNYVVAASSTPPPPRSQAWFPIVGETWKFCRPNQSLLFMQRRVRKYGETFQSHLFGDRIIVSCSPKVNQFICQHEHKLFKSNYPRSFTSILGANNVSAIIKELHTVVRRALSSSTLNASRVRSQESIQDVSRRVARALQQWRGRVVCVQEEIAKMTYVVAARRLLGVPHPQCQTLMTLYFQLIKGLISIPINLPGMAYHNSMTARTKIAKIIEDMIAHRKAHPNLYSPVSLDALLKEEEMAHTSFTREVTRDTILSVLFAAHDTVSKAMTCAIKYLIEHPKVAKTLKEEHTRIQDHVKEGDDLTWENYKSMTFSHNVVLEILRLTNLAPGVF